MHAKFHEPNDTPCFSTDPEIHADYLVADVSTGSTCTFITQRDGMANTTVIAGEPLGSSNGNSYVEFVVFVEEGLTVGAGSTTRAVRSVLHGYGGVMTEIRVIGIGQSTSEPDEASFRFICEALASDARAALEEANGQAGVVLALLDDMGIPSEQRGVEHTNVYPRTRWSDKMQKEIREGWSAQTNLTCTLAEASAAFDLLERGAAIEGVSMHGPAWSILPDNPAHDVARRRAVEDGRRRAESYADAAGVTLGELVQLIEGGAASTGMGGVRRAQAMMEHSMPLEPTEQSISATVTLVFESM